MAQIVHVRPAGSRTVVRRLRERSPLAAVFLLVTVASLSVIASLLYWEPGILTSGMNEVTRGPLARLPHWIGDWSGWARAHPGPFWAGFAGVLVLLGVASGLFRRACCRRLVFFETMLLAAAPAVLVVWRQWDPIVRALKGAKSNLGF